MSWLTMVGTYYKDVMTNYSLAGRSRCHSHNMTEID